MNVKSALGGNDKHAILAECERGEDAAEEAYRKAMGTSLPSDYNDLVLKQFQTVQRTHDRIKQLRDAADKN